MRSFAASAAIAVATARTVDADRLRATIDAAEHERGRWARELHDETIQALGALKILLTAGLRSDDEAAAQGLRGSDRADRERDRQAPGPDHRAAARGAGRHRPGGGADDLIERTRTIHGLDTDFEIHLAERDRLPPEIESTIYRLVQEALTNVAKHAHAEKVSVKIVEEHGHLVIAVRDDGTGFDSGSRHDGFGLLGMRERVDLLGGTVAVESKPGHGTTVSAELEVRGPRAPEARSA